MGEVILDPIPGTRNGQNISPPSASRLPCFRSAFVLESQDKIALTGTLRYKARPFPEKGEGLVLERITRLEKTPKLSTRQPEKCAVNSENDGFNSQRVNGRYYGGGRV